MRKFFAGVLCAVIALSSFAVSASAEESFKDRFIKALMEDESQWVVGKSVEYGDPLIQFIDLDFDGEKEFLVQKITQENKYPSDIFTLRNGKIVKVENDFTGIGLHTMGMQSYKNNTNGSHLFVSWIEKNLTNGAGVAETLKTNFTASYDKSAKKMNIDVFSSTINPKASEYATPIKYFSKDNTEITKEEYDRLNAEAVAGYTQDDLDYNTETLANYTALGSADKKAKLEWLYGDEETVPDTDKTDPAPSKPDTDKPQPTPSKPDTVNPTPTTQVYTAVDLIDKTIPEIIKLMGGTYKFGNCYASDRTTIDDSDQVHYIENQEKIPGMRFCFKVMLTNGFDSSIRESLESGKYPLYCIQVTGSAKADSKTNGSMNYNDCSKILGSINGQSGYLNSYNGKEPAVCYTYKTPDRNGIADVTLNFELNSTLKAKKNQKSFTAEELKAANPKLTNIEVFANKNTNTNTNTNNDNNADTPKSPKTGVQNNYAVLFAAAIVSGAAIALTQKKRREDIR